MSRNSQTLGTTSPAAFARTDALAAGAGDVCALAGRVLLGWVFLIGSWGKLTGIAGFTGYITTLKVPAPGVMAWVGAIAELLVGVTLVFGVATRYGAVLGFIFVVVATAIAHRYWEFPAAQQLGQYINFMKNISIMGGMLLLFIIGAGRFSLDGWLGRKG